MSTTPTHTAFVTSGLTLQQARTWRNGIFLIFAVCGLGMASWMARMPAVKETLQIDTAQVGMLIFAVAIGAILGLLASSRMIEAFGTRRVMTVCLIVSPLGLMFAGVGLDLGLGFWAVAAGLFVFGGGLAMCDVAMNLSGAVNEQVLGRTVMPIFHAFFSIGTIAGAGVGAIGELIGVPMSVQAIVIGAVIITAGLAGVRMTQSERLLHSPDRAEDDRVDRKERLAMWRDKRTLLIGVLALGMAFAEGSATDWLSLVMVEGHGTDKTAGAAVFAVFVTSMTVGRLVGVTVLDRFGRVPVLRGSAALAAIGLLVVIFVPSPAAAVIGVVFWGLGASLGFPTAMSAAADDPRTAAARVSVVATIGYIAFLVGPPALGFLGEQVGLLNALLLILVLVVAAGLAAPAAREPQPRQ